MIKLVDINKAIRLAVDTGKVNFGSREAIKSALNGSAKAIVLADNCPVSVKKDIEYYSTLSSVANIKFSGTSVELGSICGKPFPVSALVVFEAGQSDILNVQ